MKQLLTIIAAAFLFGCSDPEGEANKLFTEASQLVRESDAITEPYSLEAYNKRKAAVALLEKIPAQYPQSSLSVEIAKGDLKIQSQSIDEIRKKIKPDISIFNAARRGIIEAVEFHLATGKDVNAKTKDEGLYLIVLATIDGHKEIVELLIAEGADLNAIDEYGKTPLHYAARFNEKEIVELLIAAGADVNAATWRNVTPLDDAIERDRKDIAELLSKHGAKTAKELKAEQK